MALQDNERLESFVIDATEALADLTADLLAVAAGAAEIDAALAATVIPTIHSMRAPASACGLVRLESLAHQMESVLTRIRNEEFVPTPDVAEVLLRGADQLATMVQDVRRSNEFDTAPLEADLRSIDTLGPPEHRQEVAEANRGSAAPETRREASNELFGIDDDERAVDISAADGSVAFLLQPAGPMNQHRRDGRAIHTIQIDLLALDVEQDRRPSDLIGSLIEHGTIIQSYISLGPIPPLETAEADSLIFSAIYATAISDEMLPCVLMVPDDACTLVAAAAHDPIASVPDPDPASAVDGVADVELDDDDDDDGDGERGLQFDEALEAEIADRPTDAPAANPAAVSFVDQSDVQCGRELGGAPNEGIAVPAPDSWAAHTDRAPALQPVGASGDALDTLKTLAEELVLARNQLVHAARVHAPQSTVDPPGPIAARIDRVTSELQQTITHARMQPVGPVFNLYPPLIRDLSTTLGKDIELEIHGAEIELDRSVIEAIRDPLSHLIRFACDHGIETPDARTAAGKRGPGTVALTAFRRAGRMFITIEDDGRGIDPARMRLAAVEQGIVGHDAAAQLSDAEAQSLILKAGFFPAEPDTHAPGHGAAMNVVRPNLEMLGGRIDVESTVGRGSMFTIELPPASSITPALVIVDGGIRYAVPQSHIRELIRLKGDEIPERMGRIHDAEVLRLRGDRLPLISVATVVDPGHRVAIEPAATTPDAASTADLQPSAMAGSRRSVSIIVVQVGPLKYGLVVDELTDIQEILVTPLGRHLKRCPIFAGATILGDDQLVLVLDPAAVAVRGRLSPPAPPEPLGPPEPAATADDGTKQSALLFTNHDDEIFAVPTAAIRRIERIATSQITRVDGRDMLHEGDTVLPLVSLEHHLNARPRPERDHAHVAVLRVDGFDLGLIAPRLLDIRGISTEIDRTGLVEPGVVGSVVEQDRCIRILDPGTLGRLALPERFEVPSDTTGNAGSAVILLAEHSKFLRRHVISFLESDGHEVVGCEDGQAAWRALQDPGRRFDLVLTGIEMPNMDGYELTRTIRRDPAFAHLPIIALSNLSGDEAITKAMIAGVNGFQNKMERGALLRQIRDEIQAAARRAGLGPADRPTGVPS